MQQERPSPGLDADRALYSVAALLFAISATVSILWCSSMSAMGGMAMPGGWTMSMTWMRMPGQTWFGATGSFVAMWMTMMVAMMLPSLVPMLKRYRSAVGHAAEARLGWLTMLVGAGYFLVWTLLGLAAFPVGVMAASLSMHVPAIARAVPFATGAMVVLAGALQFTNWKARHLACCRHSTLDVSWRPEGATALRHGIRLGIHCAKCCAGLTVILLVIGVMDLRAMAVVAAAIWLERLAPAGERMARVMGILSIGIGSWMTLAAL